MTVPEEVDVTADVRNRLLALAAVPFLMMVTGVTLRLHLAHSKAPARHDSEHCPICQLLLKAPKKITLDLDPPVLDDCLPTFVADACPPRCLQTYYAHQTLPRGPPSFL